MSLNKFTEDSIKNYLNVGCNKLNTLNLKLNGNPITSGYYIPTITVQETGNFTNSIVRYTIIENIMTLNVVSLFQSGSSSNAFSFNISIPPGYELDNTISPNVYSNSSTLTPSISGTPCLGINSYPSGNTISILMKNFSIAYPSGTFCNLNSVICCSIKNL